MFSEIHIFAGCCHQAREKGLHVFADVSGLSQLGGINNSVRSIQISSNSLDQKGFA